MKNAVVVGATTHVGFALCQKLINMEVEVVGIEFGNVLQEDAEEKLMEIGRNAFFRLVERPEKEHSGEVAFFCLEKGVSHERKKFTDYSSILGKSSKIFIISHEKSEAENKAIRKELENLFAKEKDKKFHSVIIPMIYGPWQPENEPIQRKIQEKAKNIDGEAIEIEESDVLYVDDVANALYELMCKHIDSFNIRLVNEDSEALTEIAKELGFTLKQPIKSADCLVDIERKEEVLRVMTATSIKEGIVNQKRNIEKRVKQNHYIDR